MPKFCGSGMCACNATRSRAGRGSKLRSRATVEFRPSAPINARARKSPLVAVSIFQSPLCVQRGDGCFLANVRAKFASAFQQKIIEEAAFYRNLARLRRVSSWKIDTDFVTVDGDELD